jgi:hypothetical protein
MMPGQEHFVAYTIGLCHMSVCTDLTEKEEVERHANLAHPTGVSPWQVTEEKFHSGEPNPCPCNTDRERLHWLLTC